MRGMWKPLGLLAGVLVCLGSVPSASAEGPRRWPATWEFSLGYTTFWVRAPYFPPLVSTGIIDQPNTTVLLGGGTFDYPPFSGYRASFTWWLEDPEVLSLEANFMHMPQRFTEVSFSSDGAGNPAFVRPFFNPVLVAEAAAARSAPGALVGTTVDTLTASMIGAEANIRLASESCFYDGVGLSVIGGVRYLQFDENYSTSDVFTTIINPQIRTTVSDTFATNNSFFGGQFGGEVQYKFAGVTFGLNTKLAIGPNHEIIRVRGLTTQTNLNTGAIATAQQGLFAQQSNIGTYEATRLTFLPDVGVKARLDLTHCFRINVSYNYFALLSSVRPGDQMDRNIALPPRLPAPPPFQQSSLGVQTLNIALEFRY